MLLGIHKEGEVNISTLPTPIPYYIIGNNSMLNKNTWGVKKCKVKKNQQLKALISHKAKKSVNESAI